LQTGGWGQPLSLRGYQRLERSFSVSKRFFSKNELLNEMDVLANNVHKQIIEHSRWSMHYEIVFEHEGKFYRTTYSIGATECQDERPWEYEDPVECEEVRMVQKVVDVWLPVP
jgi:hypothetical protein